MTDEEIDILNKLSIETGKTKSEIVIEALKIYNNVAKYID
jgi:predicted DNA-binding protein